MMMTKIQFPNLNLSLLILFLTLLITPLFLASCEDKRVQTITWIEYEPIYMTHSEFLNAVKLEETRLLKNPGKIYFYDGHLFVNEVNKGIHIIDNKNPSSPANIGFINIPANKDLAIRDNRLYADSQKDLLVFDISNLQQPELIDRIEDIFNTSAVIAPGFTRQTVDPSQGVLVGWEKNIKEEICEGNCRSHPANNWRMTGVAFDSFAARSSSAPQTGVGGSMARFAITGDYLYAVDHYDLITFDISTSNSVKTNQQNVGWAIETIFPYQNNLFIGSASAMYIYELSNPANPGQLSVYWHATACDPVVVEGDFAFVTLRESELCPRGVNRLEVVDVKNLNKPEKVKFYDMINPHGLGIDNGKLFVSEGKHGLKVMDAKDPRNIKMIRHITDIETYDVIPMNGVLMITGESGIIQYDYNDINNLKHLSTIPVFNE